MAQAPKVLLAQVRNEFGKGAARRSRRAGMVPGVLYGAGQETLHIDLPEHEVFLTIRSTKAAQVEVELEGKRIKAFVKDVQVHPVSRQIQHIDLQILGA
ncbi:MAG: 50S ribosomal protein L25 [Actinobacteria bacterium]|nr:MAG: 50S ribosomal protein L25 [Actinomycetota bacterium]